jgi:drug/metabolite transporter (DMT)-like permease
VTAWVCFLGLVLMWGSSYFAVVLSFESFTPFGSLALRFLVAALFSFVIGGFRHESWPKRADFGPFAVVGIVMLGVANMFTTWALQSVPSGLVAVFMSLVPLWIIVLSLREEIPTLKVWVGLALGVLGVWLLLGPDTLEAGNIAALFAMFFAPAVWAFGTVFAKKHSASKNNFMTLGIQLSFASLVSFIALPFFGGILIAPPTLSSVAGVVYLALIASLLANAVYFYLLKIWPARRVGTFAYLTPLVAVLLGTLGLDEAISVRELMGMGTVLLAVAFTVSKRSSLQ